MRYISQTGINSMNWKTLKSNINCNFISLLSAKIVFYSFSLLIIFLAGILCVFGINEDFFDTSIGKKIMTLFVISDSIFIYACKIYLLIIPIVLCFQLKNYIKYKTKSTWMIKNICYWVILALLSLYVHYSNVQEEECMKKCVLPDNSNAQECAFDTCDFVF